MDEIKEIDKSIKTLINKCSHSNFFIYLHVTRGSQAQRNHIYPSNIAPTVLIMCEDYPCFSEEKIKQGFTASLQDDFRWMKSNINLVDKELTIEFREAFLPRRGRINCSINDNGKWRWFGTQFIIR